ncbi:Erythronate-4-phosphate dehydrogenase [Nitrincola lacisaponensis]|uniref:Erythronate-4-phosphate dehydrogenase n=1 Tax=Nitrincola lacisaponensis TaxID=267850 RepID=A0A063Y038_9GAMM|nr:4-phosphoerythronate dehydrogenase PdxB [Nitrincola lacisaponensis]KDE39064.1 Erythronate-4-phosphate dehydrogenase [Nitrincola lacisaponensis]
MNTKPIEKQQRLKIVADENIPALNPLFTELGEVHSVAGRDLQRDQLVDADLLLVRSITRVDRALLEGTTVRFVGTATIGTDHIDQQALADLGIAFSSAPGCNADAVVEYVLSVLLHLAEEQSFCLKDRVVGIVGVGNVGSRLQARLEQLGVSVRLCDPPRQQDATADQAAAFCSLSQLLEEADIVTLHTPLTRQGAYPTHHLINADNLSLLRANAILINAGRGPVIDNQALLTCSLQRPDLTLVLDVWEQEPRVTPELAARVRIATPHIAGYSLEGKLRGTWMLYQAYCHFARRAMNCTFEALLPPAEVTEMCLSAQAGLLPAVRMLYDPYRDDRALRATLALPAEQQRLAFDQLRKQYPVRREFSSLTLRLSEAQHTDFKALGFPVTHQ